jgi:hypothetical protein
MKYITVLGFAKNNKSIVTQNHARRSETEYKRRKETDYYDLAEFLPIITLQENMILTHSMKKNLWREVPTSFIIFSVKFSIIYLNNLTHYFYKHTFINK